MANFLNKRELVGRSGGGLPHLEIFVDFHSLNSPFLGFWVIQTGYWSDFNFESVFLLFKIYLLWKRWPISVKQWKPVWIRTWKVYQMLEVLSFCDHFFGEKSAKKPFEMSIFENTRKKFETNLVLVVILVFESIKVSNFKEKDVNLYQLNYSWFEHIVNFTRTSYLYHGTRALFGSR